MIIIKNIFLQNKQKIKEITLGVIIFIVMGAYTIFKELKDSVFMITVGAQYLPDIKALSLIIMIPLVIFYNYLLKKTNRKYVLFACLFFYGIGGIISCFYLKDPIIGLFNTVSSSSRLFGWIFYLFLEGCSPFLVSALWSFLNSISFPADLKKNYIYMTAMSKLGGMFFSGSAYYYNTHMSNLTLTWQVQQYINITKFASVALLFASILIFCLIIFLEDSYFIGYSDNYNDKKSTPSQNKKFSFFGIVKIIQNSYVLGIFGITFFWEVINVIFNNLRLNLAFAEAHSLSDITAILYKNIFFMHLFGLCFVLIGTKNIIYYFGEKVALLSIPIITGLSIFIFLLFPSSNMIFITYLIIRAINYTLTFPIREALFIPTSKEIQFQAKSWIDSFGQKFSKGCGSIYNKLLQYLTNYNCYYVHIGFFIILIGIWIKINYFLGKKWEKIIKNKEIIS